MAEALPQLTTLQQPAVAFMRNGRWDHFAVIRGVSETHVWLGDPSWGNRVITRERFLAMWETRDDAVLKGKVLIVQPTEDWPLNAEAFGEPKPSRWPAQVILGRPLW